jgi:N-acetylglucosamine kinase-like BadF-type ATPase
MATFVSRIAKPAMRAGQPCTPLARIAYPWAMRYALGFDGGGTKTDCVLMDENRVVVGRGQSGSSNPARVGLDASAAALVEAASRALAAAAKAPGDIAGICGGVAGAGAARAIPHLIQHLSRHFKNATVTIDSDLSMTLAAAGTPPCVVVIAGTGSAVIGHDASGTIAREGGLGPQLGDPGSAYDIGRKAVARELRGLQPGENSPLGHEILSAFRCDWIELQDQIRANADSVLPRVFPMVANAANRGDAEARALLGDAAAELVDLVIAVVNELKLSGQAFFLAKTGGVFGRSTYFDDPFDSAVRNVAPQAKIGPLPVPVAEFAARAAVDCLDSAVKNAGD